MPKIDTLLLAPVIHSTRKDGSLLTAVRVPIDDLRLNRWGWMLYVSRKDGLSSPDDIETLIDNAGQRYPKTYKFEELQSYAEKWNCDDWQPGYQNESELAEDVNQTGSSARKKLEELENQLTSMQEKLQEQIDTISQSVQGQMKVLSQSTTTLKNQVDNLLQEKRRSKTAQELVDKSIQATAAEVAKKTSEHTMQIISEQVELGSAYYQNVVLQSKQSFDLARILTIIGAGIFVVSMLMILIPFANGNTTAVGVAGAVASCIVETVAGLSFLYNKASEQFARFHTFLDRTNRASIAHAMCGSLKDEDQRQQMITSIIKEVMDISEKVKNASTPSTTP